jgi:hypothetical protein
MIQLVKERTRLIELYTEDLKACSGNEECQKQADAKFEASNSPIQSEIDQLKFRYCNIQKAQLDMMLSNKYKAWKILSDELKNYGKRLLCFYQSNS